MRTRLPFFAVIRVGGDDRHTFLHNQLSNDINNLPVHSACYATYNTPKGRVIANMLVYNDGDSLYLALAADLAENTIKRLKMFVLRSKVVFEPLADWGVDGDLPDNTLPHRPEAPVLSFATQDNGRVLLPHGGTISIAPITQLFPYYPEHEQKWNIHEICSGFAWISAATTETCVAQMLDQHTIGGVHFRKGCYPGQEIIARAQYRGQVKRGLVCATSTTPMIIGSKILSNGEEAGIIINTAAEWVLMVVKHSSVHTELHDESGNSFDIQQIFFHIENKES